MRKLFIPLLAFATTACVPLAPVEQTQTQSSAAVFSSSVPTDDTAEPVIELGTSLEVSKKKDVPLTFENGTLRFGSVTAKNKVTMFTDPTCTYCQSFALTTLPKLLSENDVSVDVVLTPMTDAGTLASQGLLCAGAQGKANEMYGELTKATNFSLAVQLATAKKLKLDTYAWQLCLKSAKTKGWLDAHAAKVAEAQVERVPAFTMGSDQWLGLISDSEWADKLK